MTIRELISAIELKHKDTGIDVCSPATIELIQEFERRIGFELPPDRLRELLTSHLPLPNFPQPPFYLLSVQPAPHVHEAVAAFPVYTSSVVH
jgi:cell wall assembly regulator SMI1